MVEFDTPEISLSFPVVDWADSFQGEDEADHDRQGIVRGVLQIELWHHEKVIAFFAPWWEEVADSLGEAVAAVQAYAALVDRRPIDVLQIHGQTAEILAPTALGHPGDDADAVAAHESATRKAEIASVVVAEVQIKHAASVADFIACTFSIPLPPWTAIALLRLFVTEFCARLMGADFALSMEPPEPTTEVDFAAMLHVPQGSTAEQSRAAVVKFAVEALRSMGWAPTLPQAPKPRRKARPKNEGENLEIDARWFCRALLYDEGPTEIATKAGVSRQRVQHAIKRVFALLNVYFLPAPESSPLPPDTALPEAQSSSRQKSRRTLRTKRGRKTRP